MTLAPWQQEIKDRYPTLFPPDFNNWWCEAGWKDLIIEACDYCLSLNIPSQIVQIKEKFGGMRFYVEFEGDPLRTTDIHAPIYEIQERSFQVCEECGKTGYNITVSWPSGHPNMSRTLCEEHALKREIQ